LFFGEVIARLLEKKYWEHMAFWEEGIKEIVKEDAKESIELSFAKKVIDILSQLEFKKENEALIEKLFLHYPLYKHGERLVREGWNLFYNAPHPFVQSIGTSILTHGDDKTRKGLMIQLKEQINHFEKQRDKSERKLLYFVFQNNNALILHIASSRKITDFHYALMKIKYEGKFMQYLALCSLLTLLALRDSGVLILPDLLDILDILSLRELLALLSFWDLIDFRILRDLLNLRTIQHFQSLRDPPSFNKLLRKYLKKHKSIFVRYQQKVTDWIDRAIEKLHNLSDKELLKYFPNTTKEEIKEFRESYS
jgi:hypothetical protein